MPQHTPQPLFLEGSLKVAAEGSLIYLDHLYIHVHISMKSRTIKVDYLARVEGEGALYVKIKGNTLVDVKLKIFEPPRFF